MTRREGGSGGPASLLDGLPTALSPMARAREAQARAARAGFDWPDSLSNVAKLEEETRELREAIRLADAPAVSEEIGDLLLAIVNVARAEGLEAERCLAEACDKFERRFRALEARLREQGRSVDQATPTELDAIWNLVKSGEERR